MMEKLLDDLKIIYGRPFHDIVMHRDMIGYVCIVYENKERYVLKLFKSRNTEQALQSVEIMQYLAFAGFPAARIHPVSTGEAYFRCHYQGEERIGILYEYVSGREPNKGFDILGISRQSGRLHRLMAEYPFSLCCHEKEFFIDRYVRCLEERSYPRTQEFRDYGNLLWSRVEKLPRGFCHGDYHTGNMLSSRGNYVLFDFDAAAKAFPVYDIAVFCDMTNYFTLSEGEYDDTRYMLEKFLRGYRECQDISDEEIRAVYSFIAIRHYEAQATIIENLGADCIDDLFIDHQLTWLRQWERLALH